MNTEQSNGYMEDVDFVHLKEPTEFEVNSEVSMIVEDGEVTFIDFKTNQTVTMSEWEFSEVDLKYIYTRLEEKNPAIKSNRLARQKYEEEQEQINDQSDT